MAFKLPSFAQWKQIFNVLTGKEKIAFVVFFFLALGSLVFLVRYVYVANTKVAPALGGNYIEGLVGQPRFINPIYGETNDIDRALIDLTYSGLMSYNNDAKIVKDMASSYTISADGKTYDFQLQSNIFWHDGRPLTADDIIFTVKTIQNSDYKSPLRANWIDVDVEKTSNNSLKFTLKAPYNSFLETCTLKILPKHIWEKVSPENFILSSYNLHPIGSGPYSFVGISQTNTGFIKNIDLQSNRRYYARPAFISTISFHFFEKKEDLQRAASARQINGFTLASLDNNELLAEKQIRQGWAMEEKFSTYSFLLPRYFAVFLNNQKSSIFSDASVRKAFNYAVNKEELLEKINTQTKTQAMAVNSPILPDFFGYQQSATTYGFDISQAKSLLDKAGFKDVGNNQRTRTLNKKPAFQFNGYLKVGSKGTQVTQLQTCLARLDDTFKGMLVPETSGTYSIITEATVTEFQKKYLPSLKPTGETGASTRAKLNELCTPSGQDSELLKFALTTVDQPQLLAVANMLKQYWESLGASVDINALSVTDLKPIIKNRTYDALLYGEALGAEADLYPFWHSSQKLDPGLNLSSYENKTADQLLKDARETLDQDTKQQKYEKLQDIITADAPAIFLYNPNYIYWVSEKVQGIDTVKIIDPAKRFINVTNWYIDTKRVWK